MSKGIRYLFINILIVIICISPIIGKKNTWAASAGADSVIAPASYFYKEPTFTIRALSGRNYRNIWSTPVKMKVFNIKTEKGGFKIEKLGGGFQTKSLRMKDKNGVEWVLRTVDKDVAGILPGFLRNTFVHRTFQDLISSAYPYAPLTITDMAKATGVITPEPELFYVPDDPAMEPHRAVFANTVCYLERREPTPDYSNAEDTEEMLEDLAKAKITLDQHAVLRARLLDMLLADWDRHEGQWRWGKRDSAGKSFYYPIAVDRDQAYFRSTGALVKVMGISTVPHMRGFSEDTDHLRELNFKSHSFDRLFTNALGAEDWQQHINTFRSQLTDDVILNAVKKLPAEIYQIDGQKLFTTLKKRRDDMADDAMRYYRFIATDLYYALEDAPETIELSDNGNTVLMTVRNDKETVYTRNLNPKETKKVHIFHMKENDVLKVNSSKIKVVREELEAMKFL
ncbi:MAG: hypothetical protein EOP56_16185 [Sphingobacteriales bacterium]|nr:MAG: hypothetical protein EOP56_16185 [Sphingobacteriales bacterium]